MLFDRGPVEDRPRRLRFTPFTILLILLWLLLAGYIITHPDPIGIIILVVMAVFIAGPTLFVIVGMRRAEQPNGNVDDPSVGSANGRYLAGSDGTQQHERAAMDEIPDEGGENR